MLRAGSGFSGPTSQPAPLGNPSNPGFDARANARWDVVPYQTFDSTFNVGVVAFHINGIDRVEFSVNGGTWTAVRSMTKNPQTDVYEYTATLRAADFQDGAIEVRAVAYPKVGEARVLESMPLNANSGGTLTNAAVRYVSPTGNDANDGLSAASPKEHMVAAANSIGDCSGATIYLMAGDHVQGIVPATCTTNGQWLTITRAPGTDIGDVTITGFSPSDGHGFYNATLIHYQGVTFTGAVTGSTVRTDYVWIDGCEVDGHSSETSAAVDVLYVTDSNFDNLVGTIGINGATLVRDVHFGYIQGDIIKQCLLSINVTVDEQQQVGAQHSSLWKTTNPAGYENTILYNVTVIASNAHMWQFPAEEDPTIKNFAVVNCHLHTSGFVIIFGGRRMVNFYIKDCILVGGVNDYGEFPGQPGTGPTPVENFVIDKVTINGTNLGDAGYPTNFPPGTVVR